MCNKEIDDKENAIQAFKQAIAVNTNYFDAYYELGTLYFSLKQYQNAKSIFHVLIKGKPDYEKREQIDKMLSVIGD